MQNLANHEAIPQFIDAHKICTLTVVLPDGTPHAAALHFSHSDGEFYFSTENTSRKCQGLLSGETALAALVIGFSEEEWITLQLEGTVQAVSEQTELTAVQNIHYAKHPGSAKYKDLPETIFLKFTPTWWRFTDFNTDPITLIASV